METPQPEGPPHPPQDARQPPAHRLAEFHGPNAAHVLELHERYRRDPLSVDAPTRAAFRSWGEGNAAPSPGAGGVHGAGALAGGSVIGGDARVGGAAGTAGVGGAAGIAGVGGVAGETLVAAANLSQAIREYGHLAAHLDPLGTPPRGDPALRTEAYGLTPEDVRRLPASVVGGPLAERAATALEAVEALRGIYSSSTGYNYAHIRAPGERAWLRHAAESRRFHPTAGPFSPVQVLDRLTQVEVFERFLDGAFPKKTRFSVEGLDMMVVMLDEVLRFAAEAGISSILIGMAHRGRLNVLAHVLHKPYEQILAEFKDPIEGRDLALRGDVGYTGDVKYHAGACRALGGAAPATLTVTVVPNPSHLEFVDPVVEGMARAAGTHVDAPGPPRFSPEVALPVLIHGDASFPGQGIVAETLNFSRLPGYTTGGTVHIMANNQLGFTTDPVEGRSTTYASDLAKGFEIPVAHVNADDPEACLEGIRLACAYRARFKKDFLVDLVGYRRHGHNEGDEPRFTQPSMYARIDAHPTVREIWAGKLVARGLIDQERPDAMVRARQAELRRALESLRPADSLVEPIPRPAPPGAARRVKTSIGMERLRALHVVLGRVPQGFTVHPRLARVLERRRKAMEDPDAPNVDWGLAESLALASILEDGTAVRLTGEDVERGTFSQRHAVLYDAKTGERFCPLQAMPGARASFEIVNSPLTECAAVGFEYGYAVQTPGRLVVWEAQYGDFINAAQVVIDEFLVSARAKWGLTPSLALLLPHGYEGQGPNHSSSRLERFLDLAADTNMRIVNPTTAAQYHHLLRRQSALLEVDPLPLVVLTPKSLLRHPIAASSLRDLADGCWQPIIDDAVAREAPHEVRRIAFVSGKVYVDLISSPIREECPAVAIARVEQLYPLRAELIEEVLSGYPNIEEVVWLQEEPENMGAWRHVQARLGAIIDGRWKLTYIGRPASASPAEGSLAWHAFNQRAIVEAAFRMERDAGRERAAGIARA